MFVHAEEFASREEARARYLQITGRLRAERDTDLSCYNLLYAGKRPEVPNAGWNASTAALAHAAPAASCAKHLSPQAGASRAPDSGSTTRG